MIDYDVGVVMPSAGTGERMGSSKPKQYVKLLDKPLFLYALEEFIGLSYIKKIALVVDNVEMVRCLLQEYGLGDCPKIILVLGGSSRHRSIKAGLCELHRLYKETELKLVLIHDGVRPLIPNTLLPELLCAAEGVGAAGFTRPLVSTILRSNTETTLPSLESSLVRAEHVASETPQAFQMSSLLTAYSKCTEEELEKGTECLQLLLKYCSVKARLIPGPEELLKVTYRRDMYTAEALIRERLTDVCIISQKETEALRILEERLQGRTSSLRVILGEVSTKDEDNNKMYNTLILFHCREIQDLHLLDFANIIDLEKKGLIIHVIDHASIDGLQSMSVYNLHRNSRKMAHNYEKLRKGVVLVHCVTCNEFESLVNIIISLLSSDPNVFSGQTLFI